jgi:hypothetical protein
MSPYGWYVQFPGELLLLTSTRDLIDWGVRRRVAVFPNVRIHQGADVAGLILGPGDGVPTAVVVCLGSGKTILTAKAARKTSPFLTRCEYVRKLKYF